MSCSYIPDGYTIDGVIDESPGLYDRLEFSYRPMVSHERRAVRNEIKRFADEEPVNAEEAAASALSNHIVTWDMKDPDGDHVPVDAPSIMRLQPNLSAKLFQIVAGVIPPDNLKVVDEEYDLKN